ncbi:MAG: peptidase, partial [Eggerthellaceae bacterium]
MTLTLVGSNYICGHRLEASPGVAVRGTSSLTINGKGTLNAVGAGTGRQPCILGEPNTTISIAGGTVLAHSGVTGGNGITAGKLVVSGGTVEALSQSSGSAAITASKSITISGGSVTAKGSKFVAGIGSDHYGSCGSITI